MGERNPRTHGLNILLAVFLPLLLGACLLPADETETSSDSLDIPGSCGCVDCSRDEDLGLEPQIEIVEPLAVTHPGDACEDRLEVRVDVIVPPELEQDDPEEGYIVLVSHVAGGETAGDTQFWAGYPNGETAPSGGTPRFRLSDDWSWSGARLFTYRDSQDGLGGYDDALLAVLDTTVFPAGESWDFCPGAPAYDEPEPPAGDYAPCTLPEGITPDTDMPMTHDEILPGVPLSYTLQVELVDANTLETVATDQVEVGYELSPEDRERCARPVTIRNVQNGNSVWEVPVYRWQVNPTFVTFDAIQDRNPYQPLTGLRFTQHAPRPRVGGHVDVEPDEEAPAPVEWEDEREYTLEGFEPVESVLSPAAVEVGRHLAGETRGVHHHYIETMAADESDGLTLHRWRQRDPVEFSGKLVKGTGPWRTYYVMELGKSPHRWREVPGCDSRRCPERRLLFAPYTAQVTAEDRARMLAPGQAAPGHRGRWSSTYYRRVLDVPTTSIWSTPTGLVQLYKSDQFVESAQRWASTLEFALYVLPGGKFADVFVNGEGEYSVMDFAADVGWVATAGASQAGIQIATRLGANGARAATFARGAKLAAGTTDIGAGSYQAYRALVHGNRAGDYGAGVLGAVQAFVGLRVVKIGLRGRPPVAREVLGGAEVLRPNDFRIGAHISGDGQNQGVFRASVALDGTETEMIGKFFPLDLPNGVTREQAMQNILELGEHQRNVTQHVVNGVTVHDAPLYYSRVTLAPGDPLVTATRPAGEYLVAFSDFYRQTADACPYGYRAFGKLVGGVQINLEPLPSFAMTWDRRTWQAFKAYLRTTPPQLRDGANATNFLYSFWTTWDGGLGKYVVTGWDIRSIDQLDFALGDAAHARWWTNQWLKQNRPILVDIPPAN